ncbi:MAG: sugar phosphate isomerase/epimerase [Armatimonadetes bacterium]|nr:sugar phosphate isomerase/epimerase [Armatimonadota bacterium]
MARVYLHTYTYRGYPLERALRKAREHGYDGIEASGGALDDLTDHRRDIPKAFDLAKRIGVSIPVVAAPTAGVLSADASERAAAVARLVDFVRFARDAGAGIANGFVGQFRVSQDDPTKNGSAAATEDDYERAAEAFRRVGEVARSVGFLFVFEIHPNILTDTAASTKKLLDMIACPAVKANIDPGNMLATPNAEPPLEGIDILGDRIGYVHVKNLRRVGYRRYGVDAHCWLEAGEIDWFAVLRKLAGIGYGGAYCIEYCGGGDPSVPAERDLLYLRSRLAEVEADSSA